MIRKILGSALSLAAVTALAQTPPATPSLSFEAASVKPAAPQAGRGIRVMMGGDPGRVNYSNVSLRDLIRQAYQLKDYQISGPDWINSQRFDVNAKMPEGSKESDKPAMLQTLLAERFKLTLHREKKDLPAFAMVVAKGGVKMKEFVKPADDGNGPSASDLPPLPKVGLDGTMKIPAGGRAGMIMMGMGRFQGTGIKLAQLADVLTRQMNQPVLDETGLTKEYDVALNWTPEAGEGMQGMMMMGPPPGGGGAADGHPGAPDGTAPPLQIALQQQLGLRLEAKKLPLEMVIVDHLEKVPTEN